MLGVVLIYVGVVLILNGIGRLCNVDANIVAVIQGNYFAAGTGLLFGFTYLYIAARSIFNLDGRLYGWYCLFVAINTIPLAFIDANTLRFIDFTIGNIYWIFIWLLWGLLWLTGFIELVMKKDLGKFVGYLSVFDGIFTAWIPGFLLLINMYPK